MSAPDSTPVVHGGEQTPPTRPQDTRDRPIMRSATTEQLAKIEGVGDHHPAWVDVECPSCGSAPCGPHPDVLICSYCAEDWPCETVHAVASELERMVDAIDNAPYPFEVLRDRDLAAAATPGPWEANRDVPDHWEWSVDGVTSDGQHGIDVARSLGHPDARWVAALSPAVAPMIEFWLRETATAFVEFGDYWITIPEACRQALNLARVLCPDLAEEKTP